MSIQRYHFYNIYGTPIPDNKVMAENGDYVLYTDHAAEVERLKDELHTVKCDRDGFMAALEKISAERDAAVREFLSGKPDDDEGRGRPVRDGAKVMTTREAIYKTALEIIAEGNDAVCTDYGWMGLSMELDDKYMSCPKCESEATRTGADEIAAYALAQGEKGE